MSPLLDTIPPNLNYPSEMYSPYKYDNIEEYKFDVTDNQQSHYQYHGDIVKISVNHPMGDYFIIHSDLMVLMNKCESFQNLKAGWDSYDAEPPNSIAINNAKTVLTYLSGSDLKPSRIAPSVEGGVGIIFTQDCKYLGIECLNSNEILLGYSDGKGRIEVREFDSHSIKEVKLESIIREFFNS
ncbi:MAG: hypothetical protein AB1656_16260 [Candidatus Omnitrophota bacterium]